MFSQLFSPKSVALIGASATPGKLGFDMLSNLVNSEYSGEIFPVNPNAKEILEKKTFESVRKIPQKVDLGIIAVPASYVEEVVRECAEKKIQNLIIISAGFKEIGEEGEQMEQNIQKIIKKHKIQLIGPNCLGILNPHADLNASFAEGMPKKGNVALISQSGAMAVAILDWAAEENIGFSKIVSLGNKAGITENDLLEYLKNDADSEVILLYLESFAHGKEFLEIASEVSRKKPIIVLKSGTSEEGTKAIRSHTGSLAGSNTAVETALKQSGCIRAGSIEDFFDYARAMSMKPLPKGNRVAIITNAGGPGVISTDAVSESHFLKMSHFSPETTQKLEKSLPKTANILNPVDVIGDALADRYESALSTVLDDENVDMALTILTPQVMTQKEQTERIIVEMQKRHPETPLFASFIGGKSIAYAVEKLHEDRIPHFKSPERATAAMEQMVRLNMWRQKIHKKQKLPPLSKKIQSLRKKIATFAKTSSQLSPELSHGLLDHYHISLPPLEFAQNAKDVVEFASKIGFPVVLKIASDDIIHKTDVGGVRLALKNEGEVKNAYTEILHNVRKNVPKAKIRGVLVQKMYHFGREVIIGMKRDSQFGPIIMFGLGGVYVEVMKDVSFRIAPIGISEARDMIQEIRAIALLKGVRGEAPADIEKLAETIVQISRLSLEIPEIKELDINPLLVLSKGKGVSALDSRFLLG